MKIKTIAEHFEDYFKKIHAPINEAIKQKNIEKMRIKKKHQLKKDRK